MTGRPGPSSARSAAIMPGLRSAPDLLRAPDLRGAPGPRDGALVLGCRVDYDVHEQIRLSGPRTDSLTDHQRRHHHRPGLVGIARDHLLDVLDRIDLAGRGGGHFPAAVKWRAALSAGGGGVVVGNGAEGEPASAKDAALLQHRPHLVLDGLVGAAEAMGARRAVLWLHEDALSTVRTVRQALAERRAAGLREPDVEIVLAPSGYLSGEATAIVSALAGGPALPQFRRAPLAVSGLGGEPTLVHNVETLARVALAARLGAERYQDSTLVTVVSSGRRTVLEVDPADTVAEVTAAAVLGDPRPWHGTPAHRPGAEGSPRQADLPPHAVLLGGYGGTWLPWSAAADLPLEHRALRAAGAVLGAGLIAPLPADRCGIAQTSLLVDYLARSGARQCGPCLFGLDAIAGLFRDLAAGRARRRQLGRLLGHAGEVEGRGACRHPDGVIRLVRTALATFAEDTEHHLRGRCLHVGGPAVLPVPAGVRT